MKKLSREFKIGSFVLAVLVISFFIINFLRGKDIFNREMSVISSYDDIEGLVQSDPVYIKGYKAGTVASVEYNPETGLFDVTCSVQKKFRIPSDSKMTIYSRDIMGGKAVRIDQGVSDVAATDGAVLSPATQPDMLASISEQIVPLLSKTAGTVESLDSAASSLNSLLGRENREAVGSILKRLDATMYEAQKVSAAIGDRSDELALFVDNLASFSSKLDSIALKADSAVTGIGDVAESLNRADIEGLVISFKDFLDSLQDPDGTIGKFLYDGKVYDSLESLISDADTLLKKIEENPKKYIRISIF